MLVLFGANSRTFVVPSRLFGRVEGGGGETDRLFLDVVYHAKSSQDGGICLLALVLPDSASFRRYVYTAVALFSRRSFCVAR